MRSLQRNIQENGSTLCELSILYAVAATLRRIIKDAPRTGRGQAKREENEKKKERGKEEERSRTTREGEKQSGKMTRGWYREVENGDFDDAVFSVSVAA